MSLTVEADGTLQLLRLDIVGADHVSMAQGGLCMSL